MTLALIALAALAPSDVVDVGPTGSYADIQSAVFAANEGDVLRIAPGTYDSFAVFGKSLTLVPAAGSYSVEGVVRVQNLALGQSFTMQGAMLEQLYSNFGEERLIVGGNVGSVRFEGIRAETEWVQTAPPWEVPTRSLRVVDSFDVSFVDCHFGSAWAFDMDSDRSYGIGAVRLIDSTVAMFGCTAEAGPTGSSPAISCVGTELLAIDVEASGSLGSNSYTAGFSGTCYGIAHGGSPGVTLDMNSFMTHAGCTFLGGSPGYNGCSGGTASPAPPVVGTAAQVLEVDGAGLDLSAPYTASAGGTIPVTASGGLDDLTFLVMGPAASRRDLPGFVGDLLLGGPHGSVQRFALGTGSQHSVNLPAPILDPLGIEAMHLQAAHVRPDPTAPNGSVVMFGPPRVVTVLGSAW